VTVNVNPVLLYHPDAYNVVRDDLKGRHSVGETFLSAYLEQKPHDEIYALCQKREHFDELAKTVAQAGRALTARHVKRDDIATLERQGVLHLPHPMLADEARIRSFHGDHAYALTGLTHTVSSLGVLRNVEQFAVAQVMPWDALICTSPAVKSALTVVLERSEENLRRRTGATRFVRPLLPVIPLAIPAARFRRSASDRSQWRERLGLSGDTTAILFFGRLSFHAKASPFQLAQAAELAAQASKLRFAIIWCGWFSIPTH
jgi:starch synthase